MISQMGHFVLYGQSSFILKGGLGWIANQMLLFCLESGDDGSFLACRIEKEEEASSWAHKNDFTVHRLVVYN